MRISDWSSDVCSSDLGRIHYRGMDTGGRRLAPLGRLNRSFRRALTFRAERRGEIMVRSRKLYRRSNDSCSRPEPSVRYCNQEDEAGARKSVVEGEGGSVRVSFGRRRFITTTIHPISKQD